MSSTEQLSSGSKLDQVLPNGLTLREINAVPTDEGSFDFPPDLPPKMRAGVLEVQRRFLASLRDGVGLGRCFIVTLQLKDLGFTHVPGRFEGEPSKTRPHGFSKSHSWAEHNGVIYEITGAQFNDRLPETDLLPLGLTIIRPGDRMYNAFVPHEPRKTPRKPSIISRWFPRRPNRTT